MTTTKKPKVWGGPKPVECNICKDKIIDRFVDGRTTVGVWAIMCSACHTFIGVGLGPGLGQLYRLQDGKFVKQAG